MSRLGDWNENNLKRKVVGTRMRRTWQVYSRKRAWQANEGSWRIPKLWKTEGHIGRHCEEIKRGMVWTATNVYPLQTVRELGKSS